MSSFILLLSANRIHVESPFSLKYPSFFENLKYQYDRLRSILSWVYFCFYQTYSKSIDFYLLKYFVVLFFLLQKQCYAVFALCLFSSAKYFLDYSNYIILFLRLNCHWAKRQTFVQNIYRPRWYHIYLLYFLLSVMLWLVE